MPKRIIDLSVPLQAGIASDPPGFQPQIDYLDHGAGARQVVATFPGLRLEDLVGQEGWAVELVRMSTHAGTHMDAPYHYRSMNDDGQPMATVDEIPLEWCIGPGVKLDFRHVPDGHVVSPEELDAELSRIRHTLSPGRHRAHQHGRRRTLRLRRLPGARLRRRQSRHAAPNPPRRTGRRHRCLELGCAV